MNLDLPPVPPPAAAPPPPAPEPANRPRAAAAPGEAVARLLERVRARQRRLLWAEGALWGAGVGLLGLLLAGFAASVSAGLGLAALALAGVGALAAAGYVGLWRAHREVGDATRTARLVGRRRPELGLDVLGAVELGGVADGHSAELAEAHRRRVDARVERLEAREVVDARGLERAGLALAAVALLAVLVLGVLGGAARWRGGLGRLTGAAGGEAAEAPPPAEPITGDIELTYRYPAYTGLEPRTVPGTNGEVSAPAGTEVRLSTRADRDVARAQLEVNGQPLPLQVQGGRALSGGFVARKPGAYRFVFYGPKGELLARGPDIAIAVEADAAPRVQLLVPPAELEVDPGQKVVLRYEASDDHGLSALALVFRAPGAKDETRVKLPLEDGRTSRGSFQWDLGSLKLAPGARLAYYVEARDNDAVEGPKRGVSRTNVLKVYSAAEHRRAALERAEALWEKLVGQLADRLEGPERRASKDPQAVARGAHVDTQGLALVGELSTAARELGRERDAPAALVGALGNIADGLGPRVRATQDMRRLYLRYQKLRADDWGTGSRLTAVVNEEVAELERDVLYLEGLLDRQRLEALQELARQLAGEKRELARLLEDFKKSPTPEARDQVLQQLQALRQRVDELMRRMAELRQGIRDEHLNAEALEEMMQEEDMSGALDKVEDLVRQGKTDQALAELQKLSTQMEQMLQGLEGAEDGQGGEQYAELREQFGKFMKDLDQTAQEQQQVAEQTRSLRDKARAQGKERLAQKGQALKQQLLEKAEAARRDYRSVEPDALHPRSARPLEEVQAELDNVQRALEVNDFDLAAEAASRAEEASQQLSMMGEQQKELDQLYGNPPDALRQSSELARRLKADADKVGEVSRALQGLFPQPGSGLSDAERQQLRQLAERQKQLEGKAQGLQEQMQQMQETAPVFGEEAMKQMQGVGQRMGEAAQRMGARDPQRGYGEQQAALDGLQRFRQQLQQGQKGGKGGKGIPLPMGGSPGRREGDGRNSPQDKVELPDADAFQAPREFRKDLLDAMKQGAPEKYREQVKRYYEELVK